ncbi:unnamed protein product [Symbiodinium sp. CCMP2592]|nr:unnamed protein product [Symbiodinium sp. CCMP2592]
MTQHMHKPKRNLSRVPAQPRVFSQHLVAPAGTESIGYDVNESAQHVDYFERVGLFSTKFTQSMWLSFGAFRWILLLVIGAGAGAVPVPQVNTGNQGNVCTNKHVPRAFPWPRRVVQSSSHKVSRHQFFDRQQPRTLSFCGSSF